MTFRSLLLPLTLLSSPAFAEDLPRTEPVSECFITVPDTVAENSGADCGYVVVAQDRSAEAGGEIKLPYMRIRAAEDTGAPPLFMLAGGPGETRITDQSMLLFGPDFLGPLLASRDVILMEQRGTFRAEPNLTCPESQPIAFQALVDGLDDEASTALLRQKIKECMERLTADGVNFGSYNTVESASDVNDVRAALGYEKIALYGSSYATLLNQFVMRQYPDTLAAVILDGVESPTTQSWVQDRARRAQWGLDTLVELCSQQPKCAETYDIPALVEAAFAALGDEPVAVTLPLPEGAPASGNVELHVGRDSLATTIYTLQTSKYGAASLPLFLTEQIEGGRDAIAAVLAGNSLNSTVSSIANDESGSVQLMHIVMVCSDDPATSDTVEIEESGVYPRSFGAAEAQIYALFCDIVDVPQLSDESDALVRTDVPVLVLSGGLDVQTPYFLAEQVVAALPNVTHAIIPSGFHGQIASINRCAISLLVGFVEDPASDIDLGCIGGVPEVEFAFPE